MNFEELRDSFVKMGKKSLKALATQLEEVMTGKSYEKFMAFCEKQQQKSDKVMATGEKIIGGMFK